MKFGVARWISKQKVWKVWKKWFRKRVPPVIPLRGEPCVKRLSGDETEVLRKIGAVIPGTG